MEAIKQLMETYINDNELFAEDISRFESKLKEEKQKPVVVFSHELDMNSLDSMKQIFSQTNDLTIIRILKEKEMLYNLFYDYLKLRFQNQKIWFCLKYKNLCENRKVKTYKEFKRNTHQMFSIDCIQITSLSETSESVIAYKYVTKTENHEILEKWKLKKFGQNNPSLSEGYKELVKDRVLTKTRQLLATIGLKEEKKYSKPILITVFLEIFDEKQNQCLYVGSHLESVVLQKIEENNYFLLSFDKIFRAQQISLIDEYLVEFPKEVQELYKDRMNSNYSFPLSLAFIFGDNISISGSFFRLKLGLLLSLLSFNEYPKVVLVICDDTLMIRRLFEWTSLLAKYRYLQKSSSVPMCGMTRTERQSNKVWTDAGALQLGSDGITIIGCASNLNEMADKEKMALFHALETNEVVAQLSQPSETFSEFRLNSTIWALIEDNADDRHFNKSQNILWTQVFGMVYRIPKTFDFNYIYRTETNPYNSTLTLKEWRQIINLMANISPKMTEIAEQLIKRYYLWCRHIRGSKLNHISLITLISLSKSMAKLSLHLNVTKYDALMAILLYEESLIIRLSEKVSPLSVNPLTHVLIKDMKDVIGFNCDQTMTSFEEKLKKLLNEIPFGEHSLDPQNEE